MHLTSYGIVAPIQSFMMEPRMSGKVSVKLHEDGAVYLYLPILDTAHLVESLL